MGLTLSILGALVLLGLFGPARVAEAAEVNWASSLENALQEAQAEKKLVMVDFYTDWCTWCKKLDRDTFSNSLVANFANERLVAVKVNGESQPQLTRKHNVRGFPTVLFLHPDGSVKKLLPGYKGPGDFLAAMKSATNTKAQQFTLKNRIGDNRENADLRRIYAQVLALSGNFPAAAQQSDTLLQLSKLSVDDGSAEVAEWELDTLSYVWKAGPTEERLASWSREIEAWRHRYPDHPRYAESVLLAAAGAVRRGETNGAIEAYRSVIEGYPSTWYAEEATARLSQLTDS